LSFFDYDHNFDALFASSSSYVLNWQAQEFYHKTNVSHTEMWSCYDTKVGLSYNSKGKSTFFEEAKFAALIQDSEMPLLRRICSYELGKPISKVLQVLLIASVSEFLVCGTHFI
jgi:hypothetical protein